MRDGRSSPDSTKDQTAERFTGKPGPGWARPAHPVKSDGGLFLKKERDSPAYPYLNSVPMVKPLAASQTRSLCPMTGMFDCPRFPLVTYPITE
jgi:hypothetical protein